MSYKILRDFDLGSFRIYAVVRLADTKFIQVAAPGSSADFDAFLAWNAAQVPPFNLNPGLYDLSAKKDFAIYKLTKECRDFVGIRYSEERQRTFTYMMIEAGTNRKAYIRSIWDWIDTVLDYFYEKEDAITNAADEDALGAITWDFGGTFTGTDPMRTLRGARDIPD